MVLGALIHQIPLPGERLLAQGFPCQGVHAIQQRQIILAHAIPAKGGPAFAKSIDGVHCPGGCLPATDAEHGDLFPVEGIKLSADHHALVEAVLHDLAGLGIHALQIAAERRIGAMVGERPPPLAGALLKDGADAGLQRSAGGPVLPMENYPGSEGLVLEERLELLPQEIALLEEPVGKENHLAHAVGAEELHQPPEIDRQLRSRSQLLALCATAPGTLGESVLRVRVAGIQIGQSHVEEGHAVLVVSLEEVTQEAFQGLLRLWGREAEAV